MNEVFGLNEHAWEAFVAYRKQIKKPLKPVSFDAAKKRLASFGEGQMDAVLTTIANGWQGIFPPGQKSQSVKKAEQKAQAQMQAEHRAFAELRSRADAIRFRMPIPGEDLIGYRTLVERAEDQHQRKRSGPQNIAKLLGASQ